LKIKLNIYFIRGVSSGTYTSNFMGTKIMIFCPYFHTPIMLIFEYIAKKEDTCS
jgi:hypothetical protein